MRDLYKDLAEYTGRFKELVIARCDITTIELAWLWERYKNNPIEFYRRTDLYIFALTKYQYRLQQNKAHVWYEYMIERHGWKTGLDYGGGIGEQTILAHDNGVQMDFMEIEGSKTLEYARWRFNKYGARPIFRSENYKIDKDYDFINAMDVLEHLENPKPVIKSIADHTEWLFCNPEQVKFNEWAPQHISKFDLNDYFEHQDLYLWRRK